MEEVVNKKRRFLTIEKSSEILSWKCENILYFSLTCEIWKDLRVVSDEFASSLWILRNFVDNSSNSSKNCPVVGEVVRRSGSSLNVLEISSDLELLNPFNDF